MNEHLENIRRTAERGLSRALVYDDPVNADIYQHIIDEYERAKDMGKEEIRG